MHAERPLRVPVGPDAERWRTFPGERTLVVAARTVVSTTRVLECLPAVLRDDTRVSVVFAYDPTSAFNDGVLDLLHDSGCRVMPWTQLRDLSPDLVLTASENIDVPEGAYPVLVLPHGIGFQKYVPDSRADRVRLSGLVPDALLAAGRAWLATSHPDQRTQLLAAHPEAAGRTLLLGDPCFDELTASAPLRPAYRAALGVGAGQRLVVVSSTWGPTSLLGEAPGLPARLLGALPYDDYRVAAVVHPNVWAAHGSWQLRRHLAAALDAGLLLVPPVHAWRSVLLASDLVVGDHGSVTLYGAALGRPVLLSAFGSDSVPGTAAEVLGRHAPRLDPGRELRGQVEAAFEPAARAGYADVADRAFSEPGRALGRLRTALYDLLRLPEPSSGPPPVRALAPVGVPAEPVTSWRVRARVGRDAGPSAVVVRVERFPSAATEGVPDAESPAGGLFSLLACTDAERDLGIAESASVVLGAAPAVTATAALGWIGETLAARPGCLAAAASLAAGGHLVGLRDGRIIEVTGGGSFPGPCLPATAVYACLRAGLPLEGPVSLRGGQAHDGVGSRDVVLRTATAPGEVPDPG
ncbi:MULTISPECIES: hypothetical protein [unclassified Streptomyces]|uniref:hypothetical protein n=1 Tax=unclassified Streptomyces TaxID=2593676 RepID=UPI0006FAFB0D|nr:MULTISPECIES: hypothetical protein [unclassified Streptomyces]KQX49717.1 hypothetical protein ASD33_13645 [Streptomyces sp. Root1304]KRA80239.1 hypothetical protein ASE09_19265 [Streptomyces sp. Root66D1]